MAENVVQLNKSSQQDIDRKIAVIFVTDVVGFSKSMEVNEEETLRSFRACQEILDKLFDEHGGRIFNTAGDSVLAEFQSAVSAVVCANEFQKLIKERNKSVSEESQMSFRIGLNMGDVIIEGDNLYGEGVNVAARLEALSQANGICVSKSIVDFVNAPPTVKLDLSVVRKRGNIILVGLFGGSVDLPLVSVPLKAITIQGAYTGNYKDMVELIELAKQGVINPIVSKHYTLDEATGALDDLKNRKILGRAVINP